MSSASLAGSFVAGASPPIENDPCPSCINMNMGMGLPLPAGMSTGPYGAGTGMPAGAMSDGGLPNGFIDGGMMGPPLSGATQGQANNSSIGSTNDIAKKILSYFPEGDSKKGLQEYLSILGAEKYIAGDASVGGSNAGMAGYFSARFSDFKNSCVRDAARAFYNDVNTELQAKVPQDAACRNPDGMQNFSNMAKFMEKITACHSQRAGISSVAGKGPYKDLEPGWLWRLALKHSKGDPNSAMFLIGMCGHDDTAQGLYAYEDKSDSALDSIRQQVEVEKKSKAKLDDQAKELAKNYDINQEKIYALTSQAAAYNQHIKTLQQQKSLQKVMACPAGNSGFYAPESLGVGADIPDQVKKDVQRIQGDIGGAKNIPGKYYHVYGSAFMACQLIQNGISPAKAELVQKQAARLYRGVRMCASNADNITLAKMNRHMLEPLEVKYKTKDPVQLALSSAKAILSSNVKCKEFKTFSSECSYLMSLAIPPDMLGTPEFEMTDEMISKKVYAKSASSDAAELYNSWYLGGGTVAGKQIPCSDIRVWGPGDLTDPSKSFFDKLSKPKDWTDERYKSASQKLATWDVDFMWTIAQHEAGAKFAGQACKMRGPNEKPLAGICPAGPPDGVSQWSGFPGTTQLSDTQKGVR